jgi:hypothetical protein
MGAWADIKPLSEDYFDTMQYIPLSSKSALRQGLSGLSEIRSFAEISDRRHRQNSRFSDF